VVAADSYIQVPADSTGKKLRTRSETVGANTVHHEVIELANASETIINPATEDGALAAIQTAVQIIDNSIAGSETQVDIVSPGTAAGSLGKAEDAAHASGDVGVAALSVRQNAAAALSGADGDYQPLITDGSGRLHIAPAPANTGVDIGDVDVTSVIPGVAATSLGKAEDAAHTTGDTGVPIWGVRNDTPTSLVNVDLDYTPVAVDEFGQLKIQIVNQTTPISSTAWKHAAINCAGAGDNTLLAAQGAGNKIAVWSVILISDGTVDVRFEDGAGGTAMTGQMPLQAREGFTYSSGGLVPIFMTSANTLLNLELSAAINVHGSFSYTVVT